MPCSGCGSDEAAEDAGCCSKCLSGTRSCCGRFWGGWVAFICQSNIVELAIGVAVGIAFEELIASFTDSFVKPGAPGAHTDDSFDDDTDGTGEEETSPGAKPGVQHWGPAVGSAEILLEERNSSCAD